MKTKFICRNKESFIDDVLLEGNPADDGSFGCETKVICIEDPAGCKTQWFILSREHSYVSNMPTFVECQHQPLVLHSS